MRRFTPVLICGPWTFRPARELAAAIKAPRKFLETGGFCRLILTST
jgi:hypothetical protein